MKHVAPSDVIDRQWIFDRVVEHFRQHQRRSVIPYLGTCCYRHGDDRCPVGVVLPDEFYCPSMEGCRVQDLCLRFPLPEWFQTNIVFLEWLQKWHDTERTFDEMMAALPEFARDCGLTLDGQT